MKQDLEETQITLEKLKRKPEVERYAREKKFFKKKSSKSNGSKEESKLPNLS